MTEFTNMVMVRDPRTGKVAVIDRTRSWKGLSFPGGHVERGESFAESAVREVKEETGLTLRSLEHCGIIQWIHAVTGERYIVFCYRSSDFEGELVPECDEGKLYWMDIDEIESKPSENDFPKYIKMFTEDRNEAVGIYDDGGNISFRYE